MKPVFAHQVKQVSAIVGILKGMYVIKVSNRIRFNNLSVKLILASFIISATIKVQFTATCLPFHRKKKKKAVRDIYALLHSSDFLESVHIGNG